MTREKDTVWCDGCGVEILWAPTIVGTRDYCCVDCRDGFVCECGDRAELEERGRAGAKEAAGQAPGSAPWGGVPA